MKRLTLLLLLFVAVPAFAGPKHALVRVLEAPLAAPKAAFTGLKATAYTVIFAVESGVDGARIVLTGADKVFDTLSLQGKVPVLDVIYAGVSVGVKDVTKLDTWLERQEDGLFGSHN